MAVMVSVVVITSSFGAIGLGIAGAAALKAGATSAVDLTRDLADFLDIVVIPGDPTKEIHNTEKVVFVMKEGTIYRREH